MKYCVGHFWYETYGGETVSEMTIVLLMENMTYQTKGLPLEIAQRKKRTTNDR